MKIKLIYLFTLLSILSYGQKKKDLFLDVKEDYGVFGRVYKLSLPTRLKNYPFNKAAKIQLVSYKFSMYTDKDVNKKAKVNMPNLKRPICTEPFEEIKTLTSNGIDKLSDILYNYGYLRKPNITGEKKCYEPRNGILFLDERSKCFDFIEICFDCEKIVSSSKKINLGKELDYKKIALFKDLFRKAGVKYGVVDEGKK
ncbi:hypothetical protein [Pedobacter frigiditerrae]|uniref:hypothetical protein n=1 Tax=Pedobacter frigiditerrae TaxID=2530452 RepID=UPI00292F7D5B|nr:hypothetical protein [Pedobacter frigiditerrae]